MSHFTIETDVEMPSRRNRYPFDSMTSGQSFEIVGTEESRKVRNAAYQYAKKENTAKGLKKGDAGHVGFALRKTDTHGEGEEAVNVYRLWME
jgi:hypothetical protein